MGHFGPIRSDLYACLHPPHSAVVEGECHETEKVMAILETKELTKTFGGLTAVDHLSFAVEEETIHGLIGPNGAGKSTAYNLISGFYAPTAGQVFYDGEDISGLRPEKIAERGLTRSFQSGSMYPEFNVFDNVLSACYLSARSNLFATILGLNVPREKAARERTRELLHAYDLAERAEEEAANLPHGLQRRLGVTLAMATEPRLLLLDEPFTGMNAQETQNMMDHVRKIQSAGTTVLIVEHDMHAIMNLCETVTVMNFGSLLAQGTPQEIRNDPNVIEAYLGSTENAAAAG
ncbi:MAG: ABC transporter ATP-binding protein [Halofilum sp. (in: g-proteobacteria)]|nr:ABC transporter ATP-binding protein [Halofilum sp. (in: g-proteobacteria)]